MKENMGALDLRLDNYDLLEIEKMEERKIMRGEFLALQNLISKKLGGKTYATIVRYTETRALSE
ncbi:hypothetical protein RJ639_021141 [Escallonia herrerae]|uniref:Uncharacterized protein n=1 Tax=Escallonia herrerae TaxID=1293975 RepID=A0AA88V3U6_9ASTE|nr:hypothetical protein RJ639_021141 [Escallonia herrerae]